jgi:hypothetical protein
MASDDFSVLHGPILPLFVLYTAILNKPKAICATHLTRYGVRPLRVSSKQ